MVCVLKDGSHRWRQNLSPMYCCGGRGIVASKWDAATLAAVKNEHQTRLIGGLGISKIRIISIYSKIRIISIYFGGLHRALAENLYIKVLRYACSRTGHPCEDKILILCLYCCVGRNVVASRWAATTTTVPQESGSPNDARHTRPPITFRWVMKYMNGAPGALS